MSDYVLDGYFRMKGIDPLVPYFIDNYKIRTKDKLFELYEYDEETDELRLPRSAVSHLPKEVQIEDNRVLGRNLDSLLVSQFSAREGQESVINSVLEELIHTYSSLLLAACGQGKTIMGSEIALRLGLSTCVLVHKEFLAKQWEDSFHILNPNIRVGRMQRDVVDTGNECDVVIAITQSVVNHKRDYGSSFYSSFGLIICDEVHRYGAELWQKAITKFPAKYRLGLTATPERGDGMWRVITSHISEKSSRLIAKSLIPKVFLVKTDATIPSSLYDKPWLDDTQKRAKIISILSENEGRNEVISRNVLRAYSVNRKTLVISERRAQLEHLSKRVKAMGIDEEDIGFYVGGMKQEKLDIAAQKQVIFTTYQMTKEGLNVPDLDTLIMATPQSKVEQAVGRILRQVEGKGSPLVVDFCDELVPMLHGMSLGRLSQYKKLGYNTNR